MVRCSSFYFYPLRGISQSALIHMSSKVSTLSGQKFQRNERLARKKIIEKVYASGRSIKVPSFVLLYQLLELPDHVPAQVMLAVSKRNYPRAHDRNRIRRLMREAYRRQKHTHYEPLKHQGLQAALIIIFTGRRQPDSSYVYGKIKELLSRFAQTLLNQNLPQKA